ncbi:hypothetical protein [Streptomyces sp. T028]|uniref:hypothetical protein n=1 Tax=Streptomyces sp. T028 TaxID=3394379 RepID=UPI003A836311
MTRAERRLEGGWFQRLAWAALGWFSLGLLVWVPFLYVALRRGRPSDWGACASFVLYECVTLPWAANSNSSEGDGDPFLGVAFVVTLVVATALLVFWVFDKKTPTSPPMPVYGRPPYGRPQGYPYGG